jgi:hypothetical protein
VLAVSEAALALLPAGVPARSYVAHGLAAIDCEQLTVSVYTVTVADTSPRVLPLDRQFKTRYGSVNIVPMTVQIVRCYPAVTLGGRQQPMLPAASTLAQAGAELYADGWQLWNGLQTAKRLGAFEGVCHEFSMDPLIPIQPSGGFAGWSVPVEVRLDGFEVNFPSPPP